MIRTLAKQRIEPDLIPARDWDGDDVARLREAALASTKTNSFQSNRSVLKPLLCNSAKAYVKALDSLSTYTGT